MADRPEPTGPKTRPWYALLPSAILLSPVLAFLVDNSYSLARPEALVWIAGAVVAGGCVGALAVRSSSWLRVLLLAGCLTVFVDVRFAPMEGRYLVLAAAGIGLVVWLLRENVLPILSAGFGTLLLALLIVPGRAPLQSTSGVDVGVRRVREDLPPLVVLVLDEHIGIEGIPLDVDGGARTRKAVLDVFERRGFRVYTRAFSPYPYTLESLANVFNFSALTTSRPFVEPVDTRFRLRRNLFLLRAMRAGYAIRVYESDYLDFCNADGVQPESCLRYRTASAGSVQEEQLGWGEKAGLIGSSLLAKTVLVKTADELRASLLRLGVPLPQPARETGVLVGPYEAMKVLDRLEADVVAGARGRLFLAHLMIPHFPYTYDAGCEVQKRLPPWMKGDGVPLPGDAPGAAPSNRRQERFGRYLAQVRCVSRRLDTFFETLEAAGVLEDAVVVVFGDHGSRASELAPKPANLGALQARHLVEGFSALFAARGPGIAPGLEERPFPLGRAFSEVLGYGGRPPGEESLYLTDPDQPGPLVPVPLPPF